MKLPHVAIVGRPNVGKSTLFNRLLGERIAIVQETAGVTRDRVTATGIAGTKRFEMTDTGGIGIVDRDDLSDAVEAQISFAIESADVIVFVVDAREGVTPMDEEVARRLRRHAPRTILVANKADTARLVDAAGEFSALGFGDAIPAAALEGFGRSDILDAIEARLPDALGTVADPEMKIAVVGRRNAGKSTFVNALAREERVIVSEIPGTTRDAIDVRFERDGKSFVAIDTAGLRRRSSLRDSIEFYAQVRAVESIRRADVVLLMLDAREEIARVDKKIPEMVAAEYKPCVIVANKWDLCEGIDTERFADYAYDRMKGLPYAPIVFASAKTGWNVFPAVEVARSLFRQAGRRVPTAALNRVLDEIRSGPLPRHAGGGTPKIYFATQVGVRPPTFVLSVNRISAFPKDYIRAIENAFRERLGFPEIPVRIVLRTKGKGRG
ncbi:MAG: ribosome biogenesis GTPase Der [Planctomycetes bacterium]|nr:ribosome biogenesis GTPase Der [Planctomycetota bacterium]